MSLIANISNISRTSLHDGPGLRTVVYFKGCGLRCQWCHNPETLVGGKDILYAPIKCIHCGRCVEFCPEHHVIDGNNMVFLRDGCKRCGRCADICPSGALSVSGNQMTLESVLKEVVKDRHFYAESGGGVTLSGGECLLQADFCTALLQACQSEGIHTTIESALFVPWQNVEKVLPYCDLFFTDMKIPDPQKHIRYTGQDNQLILDNLYRLSEAAPGKIIIRIPLIPGVNDSDDDISGFAERLRPIAEKLQSIEILKYNSLAKSKYTLSGMDYTDFGESQANETLLQYCNKLEEAIEHKARVFTVT